MTETLKLTYIGKDDFKALAQVPQCAELQLFNVFEAI